MGGNPLRLMIVAVVCASVGAEQEADAGNVAKPVDLNKGITAEADRKKPEGTSDEIAPEAVHDPYLGLDEQQIRVVKARKERDEFNKKHAGHAEAHAKMFLVLLATMVGTQLTIVWWKRTYFKSYQTVTLIGMWFIPPYFGYELGWDAFMFIWLVYSIATAFVTWTASQKPVAPNVPRKVYTYFTVFYKTSYFVTFFGYALALIDFLGLGVVIQAMIHQRRHPLMEWGMLFMLYGLYFGVLSRDFAEICAHRMASTIGYYTDSGVPTKALSDDVCAICNEKFAVDEVEKRVKLPCGHEFHEFCIRGWSIVGKKQTCPYCSEKVDLKQLFPQPWSMTRQDVLFSQLLDALRYLVVWQPVIILLAKFFNYELGLK